MNDRAVDVFEIRAAKASLGRRIRAWLALVLTNLISYGQGPSNPGSRDFVIFDRATGTERARFEGPVGDDDNHLSAVMSADLESMSAQEFESTWIKLDR